MGCVKTQVFEKASGIIHCAVEECQVSRFKTRSGTDIVNIPLGKDCLLELKNKNTEEIVTLDVIKKWLQLESSDDLRQWIRKEVEEMLNQRLGSERSQE